MAANIHKNGEVIADVTTHPATKRAVESHARCLDLARLPEYQSLLVTKSTLTGHKILRFNSLMCTPDDMIANMKLKRLNYHTTGSCVGGMCVGWNAFNTMWAVTADIDKESGSDYHENLKKWLIQTEAQGLLVSGALTDAKGNRSLKASQQSDLDVNLRVVEKRPDGVVVRGAKNMICSVCASDEIFILPGNAYKEEDKDFALSFVVPRDIAGLTIVEARRPSDDREYQNGFDVPDTGPAQSYLFFEDVFVPNERLFMCGEYGHTGKVIQYFTANYRACIGACVSGQGDVMIGAAVNMARANGLSYKTFMDKLIQMSANNETTYGIGAGAIALGKKDDAGVWVADSLIAHTNKIHVATLPYETKRLCQEIGGGIVETGCMPSYKDFTNEEYGPLIRKYLKAGDCSAESRARTARLAEWLTIGAGVPGCMHGGGSPDGARLVVRANTPFEQYAEYAKKIAGVEEDLKDPVAAKK
ncbi:4-hydroxybutyryl-CoA dehydratase [Synergistales bacterium]|nr:4-hydroxybutyryl-CoA dehydratase [Synergistales bacterium]